jgi:hypothetical protein
MVARERLEGSALKHTNSILAIVALSSVVFAQSAGQSTAAENVAPEAPRELVPEAGADQLISYRFRLGSAEAKYSLLAVNPTDKPGTLFYRGLTPKSEGTPYVPELKSVPPGGAIQTSATELNWPEYPIVYVEASRRIQLQLAGDRADPVAISISDRETLYDIVSQQRIDEILPSDADQTISILGAGVNTRETIAASEDVRPRALSLAQKARSDRPPVFVIFAGGRVEKRQ